MLWFKHLSFFWIVLGIIWSNKLIRTAQNATSKLAIEFSWSYTRTRARPLRLTMFTSFCRAISIPSWIFSVSDQSLTTWIFHHLHTFSQFFYVSLPKQAYGDQPQHIPLPPSVDEPHVVLPLAILETLTFMPRNHRILLVLVHCKARLQQMLLGSLLVISATDTRAFTLKTRFPRGGQLLQTIPTHLH